MLTKGREGIQNPENFADVLYVWPLEQYALSYASPPAARPIRPWDRESFWALAFEYAVPIARALPTARFLGRPRPLPQLPSLSLSVPVLA